MKRIVCILLIALCLFTVAGCTPMPLKEASGVAYDVNDYRTTMEYHEDFKILQLTDLHLGIESDLSKQLSMVSSTIEKEDPDLVILTGDNFMYATKNVVKNLVRTLNDACAARTDAHPERLCKFALTFGNHDNQGDYPRYYINEVLADYTAPDGQERTQGKYAAYVDYEDDSLYGLTNYFIDLVDDREKSTDEVDVIYRIHIIDSNTYTFNGSDYDYDVIRPEQLLHVENIYKNATRDRDYVGMAFFHIPFAEYSEAAEQYKNSAEPNLVGQGEWREDVLPPATNNGSFRALRDAGIVSFVCGHNHRNFGDVIYNSDSGDFANRAIFSFGVKGTNQLYHDLDMIGYKTVTLKPLSAEEFVSIENINDSFINHTEGGAYYE